MEVIGTSLTQAKENGLLKYATGKPCKRGHIGERYASTGQCVSCIAKQSADWYRANPEVGRRKAKRQYWMNPTKHQAAAKAWREANPERSAELTASWHARNPGGRVLHEMARRARKKGAGGSHTVAQIIDLAERQNHQCVYCKCSIAKIRHIDHRMPLALGGSNGIENIQLLCPSCNHRKQAKDPLKFAQELGILL